jgi:hypothetical protein
LAPINFAVYAIETGRELAFFTCVLPQVASAGKGARRQSGGVVPRANLHMPRRAVSLAAPPAVANIEPKREGARPELVSAP